MTKIVREAVVLMDVLAGYDGIDDRQPYMLKVGNIKFVEGVDEALKAENPLAGMNVGVMKEGFECQAQDPIATKLVKSAAEGPTSLGAEVDEFSMSSRKYAAKRLDGQYPDCGDTTRSSFRCYGKKPALSY